MYEYDYYCFSDQDDIWLPNKIENALKKLNMFSSKEPNLYCGRTTFFDENCKKIIGNSLEIEGNQRKSTANPFEIKGKPSQIKGHPLGTKWNPTETMGEP